MHLWDINIYIYHNLRYSLARAATLYLYRKVRCEDKGRGHRSKHWWLKVEIWHDSASNVWNLAWFSVTQAVIYTFLCWKGCKTGVNYIQYNLKINDAFTVTQVEAHLHFQGGMMGKWKLDLCVNEKCLFYQRLWRKGKRERDLVEIGTKAFICLF